MVSVANLWCEYLIFIQALKERNLGGLRSFRAFIFYPVSRGSRLCIHLWLPHQRSFGAKVPMGSYMALSKTDYLSVSSAGSFLSIVGRSFSSDTFSSVRKIVRVTFSILA